MTPADLYLLSRLYWLLRSLGLDHGESGTRGDAQATMAEARKVLGEGK